MKKKLVLWLDEEQIESIKHQALIEKTSASRLISIIYKKHLDEYNNSKDREGNTGLDSQ